MSDGTITTEGVAVEVSPPSAWLSPDGADVDRPLPPVGYTTAQPGGVTGLTNFTQRKQAERAWLIDKDLIHVVADLRYGAHPFTLCSCGERFEGEDNEATASLFNAHSAGMKSLRRDEPRSGPVEVIVRAAPRPEPEPKRHRSPRGELSERTRAKYARWGPTCYHGGPRKSYGALTTDTCSEPRKGNAALCARHASEYGQRMKERR